MVKRKYAVLSVHRSLRFAEESADSWRARGYKVRIRKPSYYSKDPIYKVISLGRRKKK